MIIQQRWKSKPTVVATITILLLVLKDYINYDLGNVDLLADAILVLLNVLGIWNNPTDKYNF